MRWWAGGIHPASAPAPCADAFAAFGAAAALAFWWSLQNFPPYSPKAVIACATHQPHLKRTERESSLQSGDVSLLYQLQHLGADPCPAHLQAGGVDLGSARAQALRAATEGDVCREILSPSATQGAIPGLEVHRLPLTRACSPMPAHAGDSAVRGQRVDPEFCIVSMLKP